MVSNQQSSRLFWHAFHFFRGSYVYVDSVFQTDSNVLTHILLSEIMEKGETVGQHFRRTYNFGKHIGKKLCCFVSKLGEVTFNDSFKYIFSVFKLVNVLLDSKLCDHLD